MDDVFRALADPSRRRLLDSLRDRDGQSTTELSAALPDMTRFGVMKHLSVLTDAHLVVTEKVGRTRLHYLNPVPIREIHDRWISKYAEPLVMGLVDLLMVGRVGPEALAAVGLANPLLFGTMIPRYRRPRAR